MLQAGTLLEDKYRLVEQIGRGGMGAVWRAEHVKLGRGVAVKFVLAIHEAEAVARFLREARIAAQVRHRHVVSIIDFGSTGNGQPYIVMELLDGETLAERIAREPRIPTIELVEHVVGALSGLEAVHAAGIVHRDVKPANVFLVREVDGIVPKLVDFGTSRTTPQAVASAETITTAGMVVGTPYYMSVEQVRALKDIDARTDLYSMGVILYEGLTGKVPFDADSMHGLMLKIVMEAPEPLARRRPDLSSEIVAVVEKAMARDRTERYQSARELRRALLSAIGVASSESIPQTAVRSAPHLPAITPPGEPIPEISLAVTAPVGRVTQPTMADNFTLIDSSRAGRVTRRRWPAAAAVALVVLTGAGAGLGLALRARVAATAPLSTLPTPPLRATPMLPGLAGRERAPAAHLPPPAAPASTAGVLVRLLGVPADGVVRVDGEIVSGTELRFGRDSQVRRIEVVAPGRLPWTVLHLCAADGEYRVELARDPAAQVAARQRRPAPAVGATLAHPPGKIAQPAERPPRQPARPAPGTLLGDPGF